MREIQNYIETNKQRFLDELFELIRIPSISSLAEHKGDMLKTANFLKQSMLDAGADKAEVMPSDGHPVVYGEKIIDPKLPTVMVYGHYDVQPVDPLELWDSPPFEPEIRDEKIYARGADDDKGQLFMHVKAFELMMRTNSLPCNVKFMIEGEEEIGSPSLKAFCEKHTDMLKSDVILVSDTTIISNTIPSITAGLRGLAYFEVEVTAANRDLHSGLYGGAVANPIGVLSKIIASLSDENGHITIPHFYDKVLNYSEEERAEMAKAPFDLEAYKQALDIAEVAGEAGYSTRERVGIRPALDVNGIWGGFTGEGSKTVLPSKATAKISCRLVPNQTPEEINKLFVTHLESIAPASVKIKVTPMHGGNGYVSPTDTKAYRAAQQAMHDTFGVKPLPVRSGGSIPIISMFEDVLGVKSILMGFGLDADAIHSPNENYPLFNFYKGIETIPLFYKYFVD